MATHPIAAVPQAAEFQELKAAAPAGERHLFGPWTDFLCLGGSSLLILPVILLLPLDGYRETVAAVMLFLAHAINHPHFAHSYQIFYRGFGQKAFTPALGRTMQMRYLFAGIGVPLLLIGFCAFGALTGDARLLGYGANLMALAVGWHYVKQGYGMLMVDAALKKRFFDAQTKKVLLANCYAVWAASWLGLNAIVSKYDLWGLAYYSFSIPAPVITAANLAAAATSLVTAIALLLHVRAGKALPRNGLIAYAVSLYAWTLFVHVDPIWALLVPALHSLQYLVVVWRYQLNFETSQIEGGRYSEGSLLHSICGTDALRHLMVFFVIAAGLGFLGFWGLPTLAENFIPYNDAAIPGLLFLFAFWVGINVHHYFMDNVMWRRENPDTRRYLFG